jgi:glycosyltransferase involved in cell wall biosynthesis
MRLLIATDAAAPQVNGVVRTYERLACELRRRNIDVRFLTPADYPTLALPLYREIRLALPFRRITRAAMARLQPDVIHIATEGPIGWMVRAECLAHGRPFTTSYHTRLPEYAAAYLGVPLRAGYALARLFHSASSGTMVATPSLAAELDRRGFRALLPWSRGVDVELFKPRSTRIFGSEAPIFLYVGRVSREKNIEAFLDLDLPGRKIVVGDGPHLATLHRRYPAATFTGAKTGEELARHYASADVFVFPSRSDTFGLVLIEAMASGLPIAAFPVTGPIDLVREGRTGFLDHDLARAALRALTLDRSEARSHALGFSWARAADQFLANIELATTAPVQAASTPETSKGAREPSTDSSAAGAIATWRPL